MEYGQAADPNTEPRVYSLTRAKSHNNNNNNCGQTFIEKVRGSG